jgi:aerobic-type carbon monoxide dehydrogenase small subunit (CoxS/CutS family)
MRLTVNAQEHEVALSGHETLLTVLRERLQLTGAKLGCGRGECGACTVLVDGRLAYSCLTLAAGCEGQQISTVEGLGSPDTLHPLQKAFIEQDALQCGFCTPGQLLAASALLSDVSDPTTEQIRAAMSGNLCRCGTYPKIVRAVQAAATALRSSEGGTDAS